MIKLNDILESLNGLKSYYWSKEISFFVVDNSLDILVSIDNFDDSSGFTYNVIDYHERFINSYNIITNDIDKNINAEVKNDFYYIYEPIIFNEQILGGVFLILRYNTFKNSTELELDEYYKKAKTIVKMIESYFVYNIKYTESANIISFYNKGSEHVNVGLIIIDKFQKLKYYNDAAKDKLKLEVFDKNKSVNLSNIFNEIDLGPTLKPDQHKLSRGILCKTNNKQYDLAIFSLDMESYSDDLGIIIEDIHRTQEIDRGFQYSRIRFQDILGEEENFKKLKEFAKRISTRDADVLILGESGTGKELFARAIHNASTRRKGPFIAFNCSAIPNDLLESELFGYDSGAFTGASKGGKLGKFELANGGTIFLDEVGDMTLYMQAKILRVIQERVFERVGGTKSTSVDVRIICATNKNLRKMVKEGSFREDLYYRLNVIPILLPAIRDRKGDKDLFIKYYFEKYSSLYENDIVEIEENAMKILLNYDWPGNVREIENTIQFLCCVSTDGVITERLVSRRINLINKKNDNLSISNVKEIIPLKELEFRALKNALEYFGNTSEGKELAARALGIGISTLYKKLKEYDYFKSENSTI